MRRQPFYHLTRDGREAILEGIVNNTPLSNIAASLGMHPTSISREVKFHRVSNGRGTTKWTNICLYARICTKTKLCRTTCMKPACAHCLTRRCFDICPDFEEATCKRTLRWPYTCNGCDRNRYCGFERFYYRPALAHACADRLKRESRSGISLDKDELTALDELISPLLKDNKQSPEVICSNNPSIPVSPQTLRRYIDDGNCAAIRLDLFSAPSRNIRKKAKPKTTKHAEDGRSYTDFSALPEEVRASAWEMDTVFGAKRDTSCLLTLINRAYLLFLAFKMWACDAENVVGMLDYLEVLCKDSGTSFEEVFPLILTDNGTEFSDCTGMEASCVGETKRTSLYFCDPYSSSQKPYIEGRHTLLRRISPKGSPLDCISHDKIALAVSHINSYPSTGRDGSIPYDRASETIPAKLLADFGIERIPANDVALTRNLFD